MRSPIETILGENYTVKFVKKILGLPDFNANSLSEAEAFAAIAQTAIAADNFLLPEEIHRLVSMLSENPLFQSYTEERLNKTVNFLLDLVRQKGTENVVLKAKATLPPELRAKALAVATDLVWSDGIFTPREEAFLTHLQEVLEIADRSAS